MSALKRVRSLATAGALLLGAAAACDDGGTPPGTLRFGQIGEVRLHVSTPLVLGKGELQQSLTWNSAGPWQLTEAILYRTEFGDDNTSRSTAPPEILAGNYAVWITQVNDIQSLKLFVPELDPDLNPTCELPKSKVTLTIRDTSRGEERRWQRCALGSLSTLITADEGQDPAAGRVANAAVLIRDFVFPAGFTSTFHGSYPFATLQRADDTPVTLDSPIVIETRDAWVNFWTAHTGSPANLPRVDFNTEVIIIGAIGVRPEAGEAVEIRRVLPVGEGTLVQVAWRVPGNFCSPVARTHRPIHIVVVPGDVPRPINFAQGAPGAPWSIREEVPCGE